MDGIGAPGSRPPHPFAPESAAEREARLHTFREPQAARRTPSTITALARLHADVVTLGGGEVDGGAPAGLRPADHGRPAGAPGGLLDPRDHSPAAGRARLIALFLSMAVDDEARRPWNPLTGTDPELPPEPLPADPLTLAEQVAGEAERRALLEQVSRDGFAGADRLARAMAPRDPDAGPGARPGPGVGATGAAPAAPPPALHQPGAQWALMASLAAGGLPSARVRGWVRDPERPLRWRDLLDARRFTTLGNEVRRRLLRFVVGAALVGGAAWWLAFSA